MHHIFKNLRPVGALRYSRKFCADFILTASRDLMMMQFDGYADPFQNQTYFAAQLLKGIHRRNPKIPALNAGTMAGISLFNFLPGWPRGFFRVDADKSAGHLNAPAHRIKDKEFRFRAKIRGIAQAAFLEILFRALCQRTRVARITQAATRFDHVAPQYKRGFFVEGIDISGICIRYQGHIGFLILFQPLIEEPSKVCPFLNLSSSRAAAGKERCCSLPRVSVKRKSTNLMFSSFTSRIMSATFLFIPAPVVLCA